MFLNSFYGWTQSDGELLCAVLFPELGGYFSLVMNS